MREHLFKAKRTDNGEWVEGYSFPSIIGGELNRMTVFEPIPGGTVVNTYNVDPETVCEYTGQKDEEKNEIFENDLVVCPVVDYEGLVYKIEWDSDNCRFWATTLDDKYSEIFDSYFAEHCKVIGNIYDKEKE